MGLRLTRQIFLITVSYFLVEIGGINRYFFVFNVELESCNLWPTMAASIIFFHVLELFFDTKMCQKYWKMKRMRVYVHFFSAHFPAARGANKSMVRACTTKPIWKLISKKYIFHVFEVIFMYKIVSEIFFFLLLFF